MSGLYDADFVLWSEQQAGLLRRLARGERVNDVDWPNLVEEVESLGRSELSTVQSLLQRALEHLLKAAAWPQAASGPAWRREARAFLDDAGYHWAPSMAQRIDLAAIYAKALRRVAELDYQEGPPARLPAACPVTLAELLDGDASTLAARFRGSEPA
jgi:hypothetical protein